MFFFFFFNDTATTEIYTLSLHDALPISPRPITSGTSRANKVGADLGDRARSAQLHRSLELAREDFQRAARARLAACDHAKKRRSAGEHRLRAERACLQDVDAAAHAAVEQHRHLRAD